MNFKQIKMIEYKNKEKILSICPDITEESGIYILTREENGFKYGYVGQAKHLLTRLSQHLSGYQHIDISIKKHKFYNKENLTGWKVVSYKFNEKDLDMLEQSYIKALSNSGYQMRNKTAGGQGQGKFGIADNKPSKGYRDGLKQGYENARRDVAKLFDKYLEYTIKGKTNKNKEKAKQKFIEFLEGDKK